jgi:hypothetical protein
MIRQVPALIYLTKANASLHCNRHVLFFGLAWRLRENQSFCASFAIVNGKAA